MDNSSPVSNSVQQSTVEIEKRRAAVKNGANWFYWIAGLSLVNSVINVTGGEWQFIIGLGATQIVDAIAGEITRQMAGDGALVINALAFGINLVIAFIAVVFGIFANRGKPWAFLVGIVLYLLDGLIFLAFQDWFGVGFHAFAAFCIYGGYSALRKLRELEAQSGLSPDPMCG
jgi:hypothetical protein